VAVGEAIGAALDVAVGGCGDEVGDRLAVAVAEAIGAAPGVAVGGRGVGVAVGGEGEGEQADSIRASRHKQTV